MNSLPPIAANTNQSDHPALESIAAFLDGRLPESERRALTAHLDICAACYEIYSESLRFQKDERAEAQPGVLAFERKKEPWHSARRIRTLALPAAALLALGIGVTLWSQLHRPLELQPVADLTAPLAKPNATMLDQLGPFDTDRGGEEAGTRYPVVAFQSGATLVDLRVAIESDDPERIDLFTRNLNALYNLGTIVPAEQEQKKVESAVGRLLHGEAAPKQHTSRMTALRSLETSLRDIYPDPLSRHFDLGIWSETGRLAAFGDRSEFFAERKNRKSLHWFRRNLPQPEQPEVKAALEKIDDAWPDSSLTPANRKPLAMGFEEVIDSYRVSLTEE